MLSKGIIMISIGIVGIIISLVVLLRLVLKGEKKTGLPLINVDETITFEETETERISSEETAKYKSADGVKTNWAASQNSSKNEEKQVVNPTQLMSDEPKNKADSTLPFEKEPIKPTELFSEAEKGTGGKHEINPTVLFEEELAQEKIAPTLYLGKDATLEDNSNGPKETMVLSNGKETMLLKK